MSLTNSIDAKFDRTGARFTWPAIGRVALSVIDQVAYGLVTCDGDGTIIHANRYAHWIFECGDALHLVDNRLHCTDRSQITLRAALAASATQRRSRLLTIGEQDRALTVISMPLPLEDDGQPAVLLTIGRNDLCSALGLEMLSMNHRLTLTEKRVLKALLGNRCPRDIASSHGVSLPTVRTQIQSIREKVGVRSIDALLLRAARVPPVVSPCSSFVDT